MSKKQAVYCYPATLHPLDKGYKVSFPDFNGLETSGGDTLEAIENAREVLAAQIDVMLIENEELPTPSEIQDIDKDIKDFIMIVDTNINVYRSKSKNKAITRAVTLPFSLNEMAKASGINVSEVLQEALKEKLGIKED